MGNKKIVISRYQKYRFEERRIKASKEYDDQVIQIFYEDELGKVDITEIVAGVIGRKLSKNKKYPNTIQMRDFKNHSLAQILIEDVKRKQHEVAQAVQKYFLLNGI